MARLIREMLTRGISIPYEPMEQDAKTQLRALPSATVFDADNVASYIAERTESTGHWSFSAPTMVPPFPLTWIEYGEWRSGWVGAGARRWGVFVVADDVRTDDRRDDIVGTWLRNVEPEFVDAGPLEETPRWVVQFTAAIKWAWGQPAFPVSGYRAVLGPDGQPAVFANGQPAHQFYNFYDRTIHAAVPDDVAATDLGRDLMGGINPAILAIAFMHCKNVTTRDHVPTRQERRADERAGLPLLRYRTIEIDPMKEVLRAEGRVDTVGLSRALHICRGHFAEYTEDAPLFGKHTGLFWRPQHVRGTLERGRVVKDYRLVEDGQKPTAQTSILPT